VRCYQVNRISLHASKRGMQTALSIRRAWHTWTADGLVVSRREEAPAGRTYAEDIKRISANHSAFSSLVWGL
jgi:hypothetical protein